MSTRVRQALQGAAGAAGGAVVNVEDVFQINVWDGTGSAKSIVHDQGPNPIDLTSNDAFVLIKGRNNSDNSDWLHFDTLKGANYYMRWNDSNGWISNSTMLTSFNNNGYSLGSYVYVNGNTGGFPDSFVGYTFKKQAGFLDIVQWTGDGTTNRAISHDLGQTPGMIIIKRTDLADGWYLHHNFNWNKYGFLSSTNAFQSTNSGTYFGSTAPNSTHFYLGAGGNGNNSNGYNYTAYVFADNNGNGTFGADGDLDIVATGSYTGNAGTQTISVGFEPQLLFIKNTTTSNDPYMWYDSARGLGFQDAIAMKVPYGNREQSEGDSIVVNSDGFRVESSSIDVNGGSREYIYFAIRKNTKVPETSDEVFDMFNHPADGSTPQEVGDRRVDWAWASNAPSGSFYTISKQTNRTHGVFDTQEYSNYAPYHNLLSANDDGVYYSGFFGGNAGWDWHFRNARNFMTVVNWKGDGASSRSIAHDLGVTPEMIILKRRSGTNPWFIYHKKLNDGSSPQNYSIRWGNPSGQTGSILNNTAPSSTSFNIGNGPIFGNYDTNGSGEYYYAFLFASISGVCDIGGYTGNGGDQNIDCGFSNGAQMLFLKNYTWGGSTDWLMFDTLRGINAGSETGMTFTSSTVSGDIIDSYSSGFKVVNGFNQNDWNASGQKYIYFAIAT